MPEPHPSFTTSLVFVITGSAPGTSSRDAIPHDLIAMIASYSYELYPTYTAPTTYP